MTSEVKNLENEKETLFRLVSFFDMFDFPLTDFEVWKYAGVKCELDYVDELLKLMLVDKRLEFVNGFYFLPRREEIMKIRLQRYNYAERKFARVFMVSQIFKLIPWVKLVAVGNLIGAGNLRDGSDIDIFIVSQKNRLWLTRFFCTVLMKLARLRPKPGDEKDKICLSFYVSENNLNLENLRLNDSDLYFVYWLACLTPIYDAGNTYEKIVANNLWLKNILPNWKAGKAGTRHEVKALNCGVCKKLFDYVFGWLEQIVMKWQIKVLPAIIKEQMNQDTCVVIGDDIIKLHTNDRRGEFLEKFLCRK